MTPQTCHVEAHSEGRPCRAAERWRSREREDEEAAGD